MTSFAVMQKKRQAHVKELVKFSGLDESLVERVVLTSECLVLNHCGCINETTFLSQMMQHFGMTDSFMMTQIFNSMQPARAIKKSLSLEEHCKLLCTFLSNDMDLKINFVYMVYDMDRDGVISKYEILNMLKAGTHREKYRPSILDRVCKCLGLKCSKEVFRDVRDGTRWRNMVDNAFKQFSLPEEDDQEDVLKDLVELVMKAIDIDQNGSIDIHEFKTLVKKDVLYMEILGRCLPDERNVDRFKTLLLNTSVVDLTEMFRAEYTITILQTLIPAKVPTYYPFPLEY